MANVVLENLSKIFRGASGEEVYAVKNASFVVSDKEFLVLVGPSGCGKSTTLRMIAGLEEISEGTISIDGKVVNDVPPKDRDIAMVFQNYALYPHMTVYENMAFGLKLRKFARSRIEERVKEAADILGLTAYLDRLPRTLSGGQRQRVAVGRAIVRKPKAFLFDEPLSNLDAQMRVQMRTEISKLRHRLAATMIYVTHDQVEAMTMGDRIVVMKDGVVQQAGDPLMLYHRPANLFVAGFIGSPPMNFFKGTIELKGDTTYFVGQNDQASQGKRNFSLRVSQEMAAQLAAYAGKRVVLGVRPEDIIDQRLVADTRPETTIEAVVEIVEAMGSETYLYLDAGIHSFVARVRPDEGVELNRSLSMSFDMKKAHFFDAMTETAIASRPMTRSS